VMVRTKRLNGSSGAALIEALKAREWKNKWRHKGNRCKFSGASLKAEATKAKKVKAAAKKVRRAKRAAEDKATYIHASSN
jgi:hypothetical protein